MIYCLCTRGRYKWLGSYRKHLTVSRALLACRQVFFVNFCMWKSIGPNSLCFFLTWPFTIASTAPHAIVTCRESDSTTPGYFPEATWKKIWSLLIRVMNLGAVNEITVFSNRLKANFSLKIVRMVQTLMPPVTKKTLKSLTAGVLIDADRFCRVPLFALLCRI